MNMILILIIMLMRVIQSVYSKQASILMPPGLKSYAKYLSLYQGIAMAFAAVTLITGRQFYGLNPFTVVTAGISGSFIAVNVVCGINSMKGGTMVLQSIFSTAGLLVPCILGIFVFDEKLTVLQLISIAGVLASAVILIMSSKKEMGKFTLKTFFWLILSFLSNGITMFCQKLFGMVMPDGNVSLFSMITFLIPTVIVVIAAIILPADNTAATKTSGKLMKCAVYKAFAVFVVQQLVTILTPKMTSAVLFTLVNGSATIITAVTGAVMYKEKITFKSALGIVIGIVSLIAINS